MKQLSFLPGEMSPLDRRLTQHALRVLDRHLHEPGVAFTSTHAVHEWLRLQLATLEREDFGVLYLDNQNQLIAYETLFTGTINRTEVHPLEMVKRALYFNTAAMILTHNHPSGETTPSQADKALTQRLVQVLQLVDIQGHIDVSITLADAVNFMVEKYELVRIDRKGFSWQEQTPYISAVDILRARRSTGLLTTDVK